MQNERIERTLQEMKKLGLSQMVVTDPASLFYFTDHYEEPFERFWALLLKADGAHRLVANRLFTLSEVEGVEILRYSDGESGPASLLPYLDKSAPLGVDGSMKARFLLELMEKQGASSFVDASAVMQRVRACKDEKEQEKMREASRINDLAMGEFQKLIRAGITEIGLAEQLLSIYRSLGADGYSFEPLVGFGGNAANGHHGPDQTVLREGQCVLIDVGCKKDGFCADMTRTFFLGEPDEESRRVYETVLAAQLTAEAMIRPGVCLSEVDKAAREVITRAGYGPFFTHRLGHFIGLDVHEAGDVSSHSDLVAAPGMIFSIEPGIYLPGKVGVRIEDLVLVTRDGVEILNHYPKELTVLPVEERE